MNAPPDNILADPDALFAWFMLADPRIMIETAAAGLELSDWVAIAQDNSGQWYVYDVIPHAGKPPVFGGAWVGGRYLGLGRTETMPDWDTKVYKLTRPTS